METIKVAIADDHSLFREGLKFILAKMSGIELILEVSNGVELLKGFEKEVPNVVLLDLEMPNGDGVETCKQLKKDYPEVKVLVLTMHSEERMISYLMEIGANGYLLKDIRHDVLKNAIEAVHTQGFYFTNEVSKSLLEGLKKHSRHVPKFGMEVSLSTREKEVLELIAKELTTLEIGERLFISERTVEGHRKNLLSKFDVKNTAGLILKAVKQGFLQV
ncbi:response regulator transcription factor [uncultured Roseivirga sp.]|uniref:response regulator transcription factor n=1 Tax=uncultured Roseivirga sp. TaxID=543088 RepID=UPI0030DA28B2|tara:strand:- start:5662 stop:6315 length:654 start_codon:yes stop_codon:yes gene_type:complete